MKNKIIIGTRGSELALWQTKFVKKELKKINRNINIEIKIITTKGDKILDVPLAKIGDKGLFTKELENELLNGGIDIAVHSLKDMETTQLDNLEIAAVTKRHDPRDVLIARKKGTTIFDLKEGAVVATSSLRRASQLKHLRPDITTVDLRGNVPTRIEKFIKSDWDAIILAAAGVERLKLHKYISSYIEPEIILPAAGQAALAIQIKNDNYLVKEIVSQLNDKETYITTTAERSFLKALQGGCQIPVGVYAVVKSSGLYIDGIIGSLDGSITYRKKEKASKKNPESAGIILAKKLLEAGAEEILKELRK